jgi:hypothetical protein
MGKGFPPVLRALEISHTHSYELISFLKLKNKDYPKKRKKAFGPEGVLAQAYLHLFILASMAALRNSYC